MTPSARLGGFKVLKNIIRISPVFPKETTHFPSKICHALAEEKINLPYLSFTDATHSWGMNIVMDVSDGLRASDLLEKYSGNSRSSASKAAILSIFPHQRDPAITGSLLEAFARESLEPEALAISPSALSVVLKEEALDRARDALFNPFNFSTYRTPTDWKLAQKGKEELYREVVASYQEKKPKVYGLEYYENQDLIKLTLNNWHANRVDLIFKAFSQLGLHLTYLATGPGRPKGTEVLTLCLPSSENPSCREIIHETSPGINLEKTHPVTVFSMNGPHFGDRYGIASELIAALIDRGVELLGLSCTIASITGIVPSSQLELTFPAILERFEVPSIIKKG